VLGSAGEVFETNDNPTHNEVQKNKPAKLYAWLATSINVKSTAGTAEVRKETLYLLKQMYIYKTRKIIYSYYAYIFSY